MRRDLHGLIVVLGARGSGKTTLVQVIERRQRARGRRFVVWDRLGHWEEAPGRVIVPDGLPELAAQRAIAEAPCTLVLDEAHLAFPNVRPPAPTGSALLEILTTGRQAAARGAWPRRGPVSLIAMTQQPASLSTWLRGMADRVYLMHFPAQDRPAIEWIERGYGRDVAVRATQLDRFQFVALDP